MKVIRSGKISRGTKRATAATAAWFEPAISAPSIVNSVARLTTQRRRSPRFEIKL